MKCLIVTSRHGLLNWYPTFLLYAFSLSVLDLQFGFQLYFYNAVFHVVECGLEADQVSNFITRIQVLYSSNKDSYQVIKNHTKQ